MPCGLLELAFLPSMIPWGPVRLCGIVCPLLLLQSMQGVDVQYFTQLFAPWRTSGLFPDFLGNRNKAALNVGVWVSMWTHVSVSLEQMPKSTGMVPCGGCTFGCGESGQPVFFLEGPPCFPFPPAAGGCLHLLSR